MGNCTIYTLVLKLVLPFLTCACVSENMVNVFTVQVMDRQSGSTFNCDIIYRTPIGTQFDVAVVCRENSLENRRARNQLNVTTVKEGTLIYTSTGYFYCKCFVTSFSNLIYQYNLRLS